MKPHASSPALLDEKPVSESSSSSAIEWDSPEYANIPQLVRDVVGFEDDPGMPTLTFRPGFCPIHDIWQLALYMQSHRVGFQVEADRFLSFRTTSASFSVFFINPGPFSAKEHVLIAYLPSNAKIYYNLDMNHAVAFFFGWAASIVGFAFTALVRQVLIYDPAFIFPVSLQQAKRQMQGFWGICVAVFVWQTLDVSNLTSAIITPGRSSCRFVLFVGFVITFEFIAPVLSTHRLNLFQNVDPCPNRVLREQWGSPTFSVMSNGLFTKNGSAYPFNTLLNPRRAAHQTRYDEVGLAYAGAQFIAYAAFISSFPGGISIFITAVVVLLAIVLKGHVYMPLFTLFVALAMGAVYHASHEHWFGVWVHAPESRRVKGIRWGKLAYRIISGNVWYDARDLIEDQKIGHYMHIPPRDVVVCQLFGTTIGVAVYGEIKTDPNGQWTGQDLKTYNTAGIQYALVGPQNLFADARYKPLWYGFGATLCLGARPTVQKGQISSWNTTIFFSNMSKYEANITTGPLTQFILSVVWNFYLYRYRKSFWKVWAYITGAALDTGFNLNLIIIFVSLGMAEITTRITRPSFRLLVDGTAVLTAVQRRDGMLGRPVARGQDGTVIRPSVRPTVLDRYGDDPYRVVVDLVKIS
ncbi:OPT oligopeptide transporter [Mycena olivaceomarginata]|nr:OPT oligopeptide transporter [Mycena olivaceomarginata]